jgi:hypothetical protein
LIVSDQDNEIKPKKKPAKQQLSAKNELGNHERELFMSLSNYRTMMDFRRVDKSLTTFGFAKN